MKFVFLGLLLFTAVGLANSTAGQDLRSCGFGNVVAEKSDFEMEAEAKARCKEIMQELRKSVCKKRTPFEAKDNCHNVANSDVPSKMIAQGCLMDPAYKTNKDRMPPAQKCVEEALLLMGINKNDYNSAVGACRLTAKGDELQKNSQCILQAIKLMSQAEEADFNAWNSNRTKGFKVLGKQYSKDVPVAGGQYSSFFVSKPVQGQRVGSPKSGKK